MPQERPPFTKDSKPIPSSTQSTELCLLESIQAAIGELEDMVPWCDNLARAKPGS